MTLPGGIVGCGNEFKCICCCCCCCCALPGRRLEFPRDAFTAEEVGREFGVSPRAARMAAIPPPTGRTEDAVTEAIPFVIVPPVTLLRAAEGGLERRREAEADREPALLLRTASEGMI